MCSSTAGRRNGRAFMPRVKCHLPLKSFQTHGVLRPLPFSAKMPVPSSTSKCYRKGFLSFTSYSFLSCKFGVHYHPLQGVGHSWRCYRSLIAQPLRSTMADDDSAYLGIAHQLNRSSMLSKPLLWYLSNIVPFRDRNKRDFPILPDFRYVLPHKGACMFTQNKLGCCRWSRSFLQGLRRRSGSA